MHVIYVDQLKKCSPNVVWSDFSQIQKRFIFELYFDLVILIKYPRIAISGFCGQYMRVIVDATDKSS